MWLLNASATTDSCKQKAEQDWICKVVLHINLKCLCILGNFCRRFAFIYINLCLFTNVLVGLHKLEVRCFICVVSAFRCAYCYFLNPARKTRPQAPRLPEVTGELKMPSDAPLPLSAADVEDDKYVSGDEPKTYTYKMLRSLKCHNGVFLRWNV